MTQTHPHQHQLHVQHRWYDLIASSAKKYEGRLSDSDVNTIQSGEVIEFISENRAPLLTRVTSVTQYKDFGEMLAGDGLGKLLPGIDSVQAGLEIYRGFPGYREGEREYGAAVFGLELMSS